MVYAVSYIQGKAHAQRRSPPKPGGTPPRSWSPTVTGMTSSRIALVLGALVAASWIFLMVVLWRNPLW